ncbi:MAG: helix-turn-helix domain-containing protein [Casimicrobiaceae bacterium]|nr:helix-turn-helix domain-containing protein [Casimicrobiaceae bacterium]
MSRKTRRPVSAASTTTAARSPVAWSGQTAADLDRLQAAMAALSQRVEALEAKLARDPLKPESGAAAPGGLPLDERFWLIRQIEQAATAGGGVAFGGRATLPTGETFYWQIESLTEDLLEADWQSARARLSALAHPVRLALLKALLTGIRDSAGLATLPGLGTTGQLYHHLKELEAAGWIRQPRRGEFAVLAERVIPLLVILSACEIGQKAAPAPQSSPHTGVRHA